VQARALCQQILSVERQHFFALNLLGVIAGQQRHFRQAADWFAKAVALVPDNADAHANRGLALQELGAFVPALECYERAIALQPQFAEALSRRGLVLQALGRRTEALVSFDTAIASQPGFADAHSNRGNLLREMNRLHDALASYDRAIALQPHFASAYSNRGNVLRELNRPDEALASYVRALAADPGCVEALVNRGLLWLELNRPNDALASLDLAIARQPRHAGAHLHRGNTLLRLKQPGAALASLDRALALEPHYAEAHCARGSALRLLNQFAAALACHERALALKPDYAEALLNRGNVLVDLRRPGEAVTSFDRAIAAQPDLAAAHFCRAIAWLQDGDYERGWAEYEWRWRSPHIAPGLAPPRQLAPPLWLGREPLAGKSIFLHAEQGLGDTIQFCRYVKPLADLGARVILEVPASLVPLMTALDGVAQLIACGAAVPEGVDFHCPLMSLPLAMRTQPDTVPTSNPYLHSESCRLDAWQRRLAELGRPRIGLAWSGNPNNPNDHNRSIPLDQLISALPADLRYVSLHRDDWRPELRAGNVHPRVLQIAAAQSDLADAAGLCDSVDLVISVDTSLAHLSAALGRPTWILLPFNADWRWLLDRDDSPWYPTVRLYRQSRPGDWNATLQRVRSDLLRTFGGPAGANDGTV
jgi:tetratricopeptide (TPR) repeat protein